jgi:hypothetical protein
MITATWQPPQAGASGPLDAKRVDELPNSAFAFPTARKEPMTDASHVRNAIARFDQVKDVTDADRDLAFANIRKAAQHFGVQMKETDWRQLGSRPRGRKPA